MLVDFTINDRIDSCPTKPKRPSEILKKGGTPVEAEDQGIDDGEVLDVILSCIKLQPN